jgi:APA family basic amino acid/polyamine antiporter
LKFMSLFRRKTISSVLAGAEKEQHSLAKHLGVRDLTAFGIAAIVGAGIFSTIGQASANGGPGVILLFIFTAVACSFAAFAYAEFASTVPVSGSAYTYSYVAFGELFAWIIGWALIMEYAIGNVTVAISWSDYFTSLLGNAFGIHVPEWLCMDYFSARAHHSQGADLAGSTEGYIAWQTAPEILGLKVIFDFPALLINVLITILVYRGIKESRNAANAMVLIKVSIVVLVIIAGAFFVDTANWDPFLPNGVPGLLKGISSVFFAYIGFDAISTTAEECRNPQRDLPRGIMYAIIVCTILYVLIALVITGMVSYTELNVGDPLAYVFEKVKSLQWLSWVISVSAVIAMASVMLVFQLGQPRIWMSMSRDGLLPPAFGRVHPKFKTPGFSTIITGLLVALPIFFVDITMVTDICSTGTLFAFCLVCAGVIRLRNHHEFTPRFKTPFISAKYLIPLAFIAVVILLLDSDSLREKYFLAHGISDFVSKIPSYSFILGTAIFSYLCYRENFSLIPSLGFLSCFYLLSELGHKNWIYFAVWLAAGLLIYFFYGRRHSKLAQPKS